MPELPEVETIRRGLEKYLVGHKITDVEVRLAKMVTGDTRYVIGEKVENVRRAGKGLLIDLDNGYSIAIHIKLTGQLIYQGPDYPKDAELSVKVGGKLPNKWTHVIFKLKSQNSKVKTENAYLYYNDLRQFGWIKIVRTDGVGALPFFKELGPEPPVVETLGGRPFNGLTLEKFREIVGKSGTKIKPLLMDQKKIGGVGNIYANDALWLSKIDPRRSSKTLSPVEQRKLYEAILEVLKRGLKYGGASEINFVNALGQEGGYQKHFLAYAQQGKKCQRNDGGVMQKIALGGRGTYFCASCQK